MGPEFTLATALVTFLVSRFLSGFGVRGLTDEQKKLLFAAYSKHWKVAVLSILGIVGAFYVFYNQELIHQSFLFPGIMGSLALFIVVHGWFAYRRMAQLNFKNSNTVGYILARALVFVGFTIAGTFGNFYV
jgi:uncharacterized membrane protein (DUF4010 family)